MFFVDTHCHLNLDGYQEDISFVVDRAIIAGVNRIVVPGIDLKTSKIAVNLASKFECIYAAIGIHPNECASYKKDQFQELVKLSSEPKVVAIGEIGLDFFHHPETKTEQIELLESMLDLTIESQKPVLLHSRNSLIVLIEIIQKWINQGNHRTGKPLGVFHSFEGDTDQGRLVQSMQMKIGIAGPVTYKNAIQKQKNVTELGLEDLVLETDSPYLSPHPFRGKQNEPSRIPLIAQKIAELLQISVDDVAQVTSQSAFNLFNWDTIH